MNMRPRVLVAITVYNGWNFVPRCIQSAKHIQGGHAEIDVLVLDDASPEPGFSQKLSDFCSRLGVGYYRTPRNLGIVRNVNLGLLTAVERGYDFVVICNSDLIFSRQTVDALLDAAGSDPLIGSVTGWSNNVSIYSFPNQAPDRHLASQEVVDWLAASLAGNFRGTAIDVPAGISFCILIPVPVVRDVGLMDPVFGRGYCEETDWSLRSLAKGYRLTLAPAAFVYHQGRGSTLAAGMVSGAHTTVPENEAIIDYRYPLFRSQVDAFVRGGILEKLHRDASRRVIADAGSQFGYDVRVGSLPPGDGAGVVVNWAAVGRLPPIEAQFKGFTCEIPNPAGKAPYDATADFFQSAPRQLTGAYRSNFTWSGGSQSPNRPGYPDRV